MKEFVDEKTYQVEVTKITELDILQIHDQRLKGDR